MEMWDRQVAAVDQRPEPPSSQQAKAVPVWTPQPEDPKVVAKATARAARPALARSSPSPEPLSSQIRGPCSKEAPSQQQTVAKVAKAEVRKPRRLFPSTAPARGASSVAVVTTPPGCVQPWIVGIAERSATPCSSVPTPRGFPAAREEKPAADPGPLPNRGAGVTRRQGHLADTQPQQQHSLGPAAVRPGVQPPSPSTQQSTTPR